MMDGIYQSWQNGVMWACLGMLGVMAVGIILYGFGLAWGKVREWWSLPLIERVLAGVFVVGFAYYGSTKHGAPSVRWDDGLRDNGTLITNDTVAVRWTYSGIPGASSVFIDYREAGTTNNWLNLAETLASAQEWTGTLANATNYDYWVYSTYVPPVPVHTNGVWVGQAYETKARVGAKSFLILNGKVQEHGRTIATPAAKRRDLPYDSEVAYLESTGTQWIDTGVKPSEDLATYITFSYQQIANNVSAFGSRSNSSVNDRYWLNYDSKFEIGYGNWASAVETTSVGAINTIAFNEIVNGNHTFTVNGRSTTYNGTPNTTVNIIIFGRIVGSTAPVLSKMRLYSMSMMRNGVLIRDYIPVRKGTTGELYDRVSRTFATRHGTFNYGSDK